MPKVANGVKMAEDFDAIFAEYAKKTETEKKKERTGNNFNRTYESVKWTGLEEGVPSVIRVQGGPPNSNITPYTARIVTICWLVGDDGKRFKVVRPSFTQDSNYILNKIIRKIKGTKYVNNKKTYPVQEKYPDIFNIIEKNGVPEKDKRYKFERGWNGSEVIIMNVIDRSKVDWHRENKHTMLLAKDVRLGDDGTEWPTEGISAFATNDEFAKLFKYYGTWEKYDIAITRTGNMNHAYDLDNATKNPEKVLGDAHDLISFDNFLTEEEKSWGKYDLTKLYQYTSATKIYNRLKDTIKRIDSTLGTSYLEELKELSDKEKEEWEKLYGTKDAENDITVNQKSYKPFESFKEVEEVQPESNKVRESSSTAPGSDMPYYSTLSDLMKSKIKSCKKKGNGYEIEWDYDIDSVYDCPDCQTPAPEEVAQCPCCGKVF